MALRTKIIGVIGVAFGVAVIAILMSGARGKTPPPASAQSCAVYVAFYKSMTSKKATFLSPSSIRFSKIISRDAPPRRAPARFMGSTGETEKVVLFQGAEPIERRIKKAFAARVSDYFEPLWSGQIANIKPCFTSSSLRPRFHKGRYKPLHIREKLFRRDDLGIVTVWRVSPIGFSDDGKHALLYAEYYCSAACGGGSYFLFENKDGAWIQIGEHQVWFS